MARLHPFAAALTLITLTPVVASAAPPDGAAFFEKNVRPMFAARCVSCHGPDKQKGGLRLDSRAALLAGGDRGPAVVEGKPDDSLLVRALGHADELKMPPKAKLPAAEIAAVTEWVRLGAPWPNAVAAPIPPAASGSRPFTPDEKAFWAFQPLRRPTVPETRNTKHETPNTKHETPNPIDHFLQAKREAAGLQPAPEADRLTLIRRLTFDLTGLPPTADEIAAFQADDSPRAYEAVVERLLASPAYGEKWGRRWLDVARYADSNGMDENLAYVNAWRYRDWVIKSFNTDKPYDAFVREQLAGDLIPGGTEAERADRLTATGLLVIGPKMLAEDDPVKMRMDIIDEQLDTIGQAFMGLTLGCARCHDHKFDPITSADYYGLAGFLYSTKSMRNHKVVAAWNERPISPPNVVAAVAEHDKEIAAARKELANVEKPATAAIAGVAARVSLVVRLRAEIAKKEKVRPAIDEVMAVEDAKGENLHIHLRGNHLTLGAEAPRRFLRILAGDTPLSLGTDRSGRREFADWLTRPEHPLTARVMVNRIWAGHFGAGLVRTTDNFGRLGERPTHPELLDWLAAEFVSSGWSIKHMHRLIVGSAAYRMSNHTDPATLQKDPDNRLLSHFSRRRLDAEEVRDGMLAVSGLLDRKMGGSLLTAKPRQYVTGTDSRNYDGYAHPRRSVYLPVVRSAIYNVFQTLDFPDPSVPNGNRSTTIVPTQALLMLNSPLADQATAAFAKTLLASARGDDERISAAYRRAFGRTPTSQEVERVTTYLRESIASADPMLSPDEKRNRAWRGLCRVLLASNEFVFVE